MTRGPRVTGDPAAASPPVLCAAAACAPAAQIKDYFQCRRRLSVVAKPLRIE